MLGRIAAQAQFGHALVFACMLAAPAVAQAPAGDLLARMADDSPSAETTPDDSSLDGLIQELPRNRASGRSIAPVTFLGSAPRPGWKPQLVRWLAPTVVDEAALDAALSRRIAAWYSFVDRNTGSDLAEPVARLRRFEESGADIAEINSNLAVDGSFVAQYDRALSPGSPVEIELRLVSGRTPPGAQMANATITLERGFSTWNPRAAGVVGALLLLLAIRQFRGRGSIIVRLDRGHTTPDPSIVYSAYVGKQSLRTDTHGAQALASQPIAALEATFERLPVRTYYVAVRRVERDPKSLQVVSNVAEERVVDLRRGQAHKVQFEFLADRVAVEFRATRGKNQPIQGQALVAIVGETHGARYARDGQTTLHLSPGNYRIRVGYLDRAFEVPLDVPKGERGLTLNVDVEAQRRAVFTGCVEAVAPYVHGDLDTAIETLERKGLSQAAARLQRSAHGVRSSSGDEGPATEAKGTKTTPVEASARAIPEEAAPEDPREAALWHRKAGRYDDALTAAMSCGEREIAIQILVEKGDLLQAGHLALEIDDRDGAIAVLQRITLSDPRFGEACLLLAQLFCDRDEPALALDKLSEAVDVFGSETSLELREQIARCFERGGQFREALAAYEHIRKRDIGFPGTAQKIEELRARLQQPASAQAGTQAGPLPVDTQTPTRRDTSRYELEEEIGRGGMGVVFRARDRTLGRVVALKRLPENLKEHQTVVRLFLREARSAAALNHPNIVTLYDAGQEDGNYYLTMEHLMGSPINDLLKRRGRFRPIPSMRLALQAIEGLAYAHDEGIIHRDIKPSNLFLTTKQVVKIMDFGLAKTVEEVRKNASMIAGTPYYMAPEQSLGGLVDPRADLYSFGVSVFEFLTGTTPFRDGDVAYHHRHTAAPDPRSLQPEIPEALAALILNLLEKEPDQRPAHASEVAAQLRELLSEARQG